MAIPILTFSTMYPNSVQKIHGTFVEKRLCELVRHGKVRSRVVAPVPWFPSKNKLFGAYAQYAGVPQREFRHGIEIDHPRYLTLPKVGMELAPFLLARAALAKIRDIVCNGYEFELIDAHYFYPDGVAGAILGKKLGKPVIITARGTDLNLIPRRAVPRRMIQWAAQSSAAMITVCEALKDSLIDLGVPEGKVTVLRNGVDLHQFRPPADREGLRRQLGISGTTLLSVGHLIERKGHHLAIEALAQLPDARIVIAGDGPEKNRLRRLTNRLKLQSRVTFLGAVDQETLRDHYGASDMLILASSREGWANVLLESMACGTPVVATNVWGTPEALAAPEAGLLVLARTADGLVDGIRKLLQHYPNRAATRQYAEGFSWDATSRGQEGLFSRVLQESTRQS